jgi:hypothetical protein
MKRVTIILAFVLGFTSILLFSQNITLPVQDGCPVRIYSADISTSGGESAVSLKAENIANKTIEAVGFKANTARASGGSSTDGHLLITSMVNGEKPIRPSQVISEAIALGSLGADAGRDSIVVSVDFVLFSDGTRWGADTLKFSGSVYNMRAGAQAYKMQIGQQSNATPK